MIDRKKCTILWHVVDLKISHVKSEVDMSVIALINAKFGKEDPITVRGKIHEYPGMPLDFTIQGKVVIEGPITLKICWTVWILTWTE